jgi:hypothetical protein
VTSWRSRPRSVQMRMSALMPNLPAHRVTNLSDSGENAAHAPQGQPKDLSRPTLAPLVAVARQGARLCWVALRAETELLHGAAANRGRARHASENQSSSSEACICAIQTCPGSDLCAQMCKAVGSWPLVVKQAAGSEVIQTATQSALRTQPQHAASRGEHVFQIPAAPTLMARARYMAAQCGGERPV